MVCREWPFPKFVCCIRTIYYAKWYAHPTIPATRQPNHATVPVAAGLCFGLPLALSTLALALPGGLAAASAVLAALIALPGLVIERWLFFAEAKHAVTLYYGAEAA